MQLEVQFVSYSDIDPRVNTIGVNVLGREQKFSTNQGISLLNLT
jgi:hypothetical protein